MAVYKRKYRSGKTVWCFTIDAPGSTRENRRQIMESGFPTKGAAENAEAERRITEQKRYQLEKAGLPDVPLPKSLAEFRRISSRSTGKENWPGKPSSVTGSRSRTCIPICLPCGFRKSHSSTYRKNGLGYWNRAVTTADPRSHVPSPPRRFATSREWFPTPLHGRFAGA